MLISLTVGKLDAGLAILLTEDKRLIEFPSILLPPGITSGSIVDIQVARNAPAEAIAKDAFSALQDEIYNLYGVQSPKKPVLRLRNATQTSIVLEWDPIELATATLRSLTLYRNNAKAGAIPNPTAHTSTKISGLAVGEEYTFHLVLRTSAGTYSSDKVTVRTHKMTDLSGITVCPGVMPATTRENLEAALQRIGAKPLQDSVRIDTTHFVCTEGRGHAWERALEMNIPVVRPEWIEACEREGRIVVARNYYLGVEVSKIRQSMPPARPQTQPAQSANTPTSPRRQSVASPMSPPVQQQQSPQPQDNGSERSEGSNTPSKAETPVPSPKPDEKIEEKDEEEESDTEVKEKEQPAKESPNESAAPAWLKPDDEEVNEQNRKKSEEKFESVQL
ncbi:hypothetical protein FPQ18DRAFT_287580 [Pyronema domesticum]|uniref:Similar to Chitin biosynthesis protein CHS5 acc. no. O74161 n=1 Tax=Pyronema omphalodes (strain CBS 100304) TaxID=1076935 RepID=U4LLR5_PYROM|nr:hypothetical protein FPQ18DRAFT_287580 [Pyronema domesticum]CCX32863.1 Similar to Chitin biosynthesis protein CHS5; acc. no. O74161 [Pyronema omphalodes CBS 100304]